MITLFSRTTDPEDVSVLLNALTERGSTELDCQCLQQLAEGAAAAVAEHFDQTDISSHDLWFARLSDTGEDGLAAALCAAGDRDVREVVASWLLSFGWVQLSRAGQVWQFNTDELSYWDQDSKEFHWSCYHQIEDLSLAVMCQFIDKQCGLH